jgi:hypothetical protein
MKFARGTSRFPQNAVNISTACSAFHAVRETSAKFGLHGGNNDFNIQNEKQICILIII